MLLVDVNVLLYAIDTESPHHRSAHRWLTAALNTPGSVGLTWTVLIAFVRLATNPRVWPSPLTPAEALDHVELLVDAPGATLLEPTGRHASILRGLLTESGTAGNLATDAHLAAIAVEHGVGVCSFDTDFDRFRGVRRTEPG